MFFADKVKASATLLGCCAIIFRFLRRTQTFAVPFTEDHLLTLFFESSYQYAFRVFEYVRSKEVADTFSLPLPYLLAYSVGGMYSMLLKWVESDMDIPSSVLIAELKNGFISPNI